MLRVVSVVLVTDGIHFDIADVIVHVDDVNDNSPMFHRSTYSVDVFDSEITGNDDVIATLSANDPDEGDNGVVTYWITGKLQTFR